MEKDSACPIRCQAALEKLFGEFVRNAKIAGWSGDAVAIASVDLALNNLKLQQTRSNPHRRVA